MLSVAVEEDDDWALMRSLISSMIANSVSLLLEEEDDDDGPPEPDCFSRASTLRRASNADDWMDKPRILKMRAMRLRSDMMVVLV